MTLAKLRGRLPAAREAELLQSLRHLPRRWRACCTWSRNKDVVGEVRPARSRPVPRARHHYPIAMEGALKLKEISYIHAEAYAAGELKHGPLALVDKNMPVIAIAPKDALLEKLNRTCRKCARGRRACTCSPTRTRA